MAYLTPVCSQKAKSPSPSPFSPGDHYFSPPLLEGLMGGLHLPALSWLLLGGKEAHPDGFQQFSWVFYGLLLIYSQFSILVNGHKLDWSHKSQPEKERHSLSVPAQAKAASMNIWKKPALSINTHISGYSNCIQGPPLIPLPQGWSSSYILHVCDELKIPSSQLFGKASCNTGVVPTTSRSQQFMTFTVLAHAYIHIPCEQGGKLAFFTPGSQFLHTDHQEDFPTPHATFGRWMPSFSGETGRKLQVVIFLKHLIYLTEDRETQNALLVFHKPGTWSLCFCVFPFCFPS